MDGSDIVLAHNDLNWENLVLGDDLEVLAVLDFDNACLLPRALDLGAAAVVLVGSDERRLDDFLQAYADAAGREVDCAAVLDRDAVEVSAFDALVDRLLRERPDCRPGHGRGLVPPPARVPDGPAPTEVLRASSR